MYVAGILLSTIVAAQIVQPLDHAVLFLKETHDELQSMAKEILVFHVTLIGQSTLFMQIRQLEFGLLQLTQQIHKLIHCSLLYEESFL